MGSARGPAFPSAALLAGLWLGAPLACLAPSGLGLPEAVSTAGTTVLALSDQDPAAIEPQDIGLALIGAEPKLAFAFDRARRVTFELAVYDLPPAALGFPATLRPLAPGDPGAAHLPLASARRFFRTETDAGMPGDWVEVEQAPALLSRSYVALLAPELDCDTVMDVDAVELRMSAGEVDDSEVAFLSRYGPGQALIGTDRGVYRYDDGDGARWRVEPDPILTPRIDVGAKYHSSFVPADGHVVWLGGRSGLLNRYEPRTGVLETVTASRAELPTWRRLEGSPDGRELFAAGVLDNGELHSIVFGELVSDADGRASWLPTSLEDCPLGTSADIAYEGPRTVLVTRETGTLFRYRAGALEAVTTIWELPVLFALARAPGGTLVAASVGKGRAGYGFLTPSGFSELGLAAFDETYELRTLGQGFLFTGSAGWVGLGSLAGDRSALCAQRLDSGATNKKTMDTLADDRFLVGGERSQDEPSNTYRVRLTPSP